MKAGGTQRARLSTPLYRPRRGHVGAAGGLSGHVYGQDDLADQIRAAQASSNYSEAARLYRQLIAEERIRRKCGVTVE